MGGGWAATVVLRAYHWLGKPRGLLELNPTLLCEKQAHYSLYNHSSPSPLLFNMLFLASNTVPPLLGLQ